MLVPFLWPELGPLSIFKLVCSFVVAQAMLHSYLMITLLLHAKKSSPTTHLITCVQLESGNNVDL